MALPLGNEIYKDGEEVDYYSLSGYLHSRFHTIKLDLNNIKSASSGMFKGTLQFDKGGWMSKSGWILKDSSGKFQYDFNTEVNTLNDKPFDKNKRTNILLLKKGPVQAKVMPQSTVKTLSLGDDDYLHHQKVEYLIVTHPTLYGQLSNQWVDLRGMKDVTKNRGELICYNCGSFASGWWIVEGGKMTHDLSKFNILNHSTFKPDKPNIQLLPSGNNTERMKQVKAEKERKAAEAAQEDQDAEKNATPIPCSQTAINLNDTVKYGDKEGIVTGFEITYTDKTSQTVRCDANLFSITAGIEKHKSDLFTKRNPGVVYAHVVGGKRRKRTKYRKHKLF